MPFEKTLKEHPQSGEDDRKNVIKQMKVRTIIKGDKSWIHQPDDTEGQTIELPPPEEHHSIEPPVITPQKDRLPAPRPSSGYIIRGVFTKPIDSTPLPQTQYPATFKTPKRSTVPAKPAPDSLPLLSASGYKVSPDDPNKIAKASSNLLQKSDTWGHSYVLSAARKSSVPAAQVMSLCPSSKSSIQDLAHPFMAKRVEVVEAEASPERSQILPSLSRQPFGLTSSDLSRERAGCSAWTGNVSRSLFSSPRFQERSGEIEETQSLARHGPKLESTLLDFSPEINMKRAFLEYKERNFSKTRRDVPREEEKDLYPDADRSSTWSTDSNHGSSGSQNDLDEIEITSKKGSVFNYGDQYISSTQGGDYADPGNQQPVGVNESSLSDPYSQETDIQEKPLVPSVPREYKISYWNLARYAGASTEKKCGSSSKSDDTMTSEPQRYVSASRERTSRDSQAATSQDSSSASNTEPSSNFSKLSAVVCTYCCKEIKSGPKITLEHLGICCHEGCFKCAVCKKDMGNRLEHVFIHKGNINCDQCYERLF